MARTSERSTTPDAMPLGEPTAAAPVVGPVPRTATVLQVLTHARIGGLARELGLVAPAETGTKQARIDAVLEGSGLALGDALAWMTRDELKAALRLHGLDDAGRSRAERKKIELFEDEVIDRLFVLNAERAKEEGLKGLTTRGKKPKKSARKATKKDDGGQQSLV